MKINSLWGTLTPLILATKLAMQNNNKMHATVNCALPVGVASNLSSWLIALLAKNRQLIKC